MMIIQMIWNYYSCVLVCLSYYHIFICITGETILLLTFHHVKNIQQYIIANQNEALFPLNFCQLSTLQVVEVLRRLNLPDITNDNITTIAQEVLREYT
jgi:hypothetical protein